MRAHAATRRAVTLEGDGIGEIAQRCIDGDIGRGNGHRGACLVAGQGVTGTRSAGAEVIVEGLVGRSRQRDGRVGSEVVVVTMTDAEISTGNTTGDATNGTHKGGAGFGGAMTVIAYGTVVIVGDNIIAAVRTSYEDFEIAETGSDVGAIAEAAAHGRRPVVIAHDATEVCFVLTVNQNKLCSHGAVGDSADIGARTGVASILGSDTSTILTGTGCVRRECDGTFHMAVADGTRVFTGDTCHPSVSGEFTVGHGEIADGTPCS